MRSVMQIFSRLLDHNPIAYSAVAIVTYVTIAGYISYNLANSAGALLLLLYPFSEELLKLSLFQVCHWKTRSSALVALSFGVAELVVKILLSFAMHAYWFIDAVSIISAANAIGVHLCLAGLALFLQQRSLSFIKIVLVCALAHVSLNMVRGFLFAMYAGFLTFDGVVYTAFAAMLFYKADRSRQVLR